MPRIHVNRPAYDQNEFDRQYDLQEEEATTCQTECQGTCERCSRCSRTCWIDTLLAVFPFIEVIRKYRLRYVIHDVIAGLSLGVLHIAPSMGFAMMASVPAVFGIYTAFWPVLFYFFFGGSRHLSLGVLSVVALINSIVVEREMELILGNSTRWSYPVSAPSRAELPFKSPSLTSTPESSLSASPASTASPDIEQLKGSIATTFTLMVGAVQLVAGVLHLGFVTTLMPISFVNGFNTGTAFHIASSQLKHLLGITIPRHAGIFRLPYIWRDVLLTIPKCNPPTLVFSAVSLLILIVIKLVINERCKHRLKTPIPADLIVTILGIVVSYLAAVERSWGVAVVGDIPSGIPAPVAPRLEYAPRMVVDAVIGAILSFVTAMALADVFSRRHKYVVNSNHELMVYGSMHITSSFFHCMAGGVAAPRCFVYESSGGKTMVAHLVSCGLILVVLFSMGPVLSYLPKSVLASIIIISLIPLFLQFRDLAEFWRISKVDFLTWLLTCISTVFLDIGIGLGIGFGFSLLTIALRSLFTRGYPLTETNNQDLFVPRTMTQSITKSNEAPIVHFDGTLYFATVRRFKDVLYRCTFDPRTRVSSDRRKSGVINTNSITPYDHVTRSDKKPPSDAVRTIIIDCAAFSFIDVMGFDCLRNIHEDYGRVGVEVVLAACGQTAQRHLRAAGLLPPGGPFRTFPTIQDAVRETSAPVKSPITDHHIETADQTTYM